MGIYNFFLENKFPGGDDAGWVISHYLKVVQTKIS